MAITVPSVFKGVLSMDEYVEFVKENVDTHDVDCLAETAWALKGLANNKQFLIQAVNTELKRLAKSDGFMKMYTAQSFILRTEERFLVRANLWTCPSPDPRARDLESRIFSYFSAHDHNFDFVTVGYMGSGYSTNIFEYDSSSIVGTTNERIDIHFLEKTELPEGKLMVYRRSRDIHAQFPPESFSVSLNLLVRHDEESALIPQYFFDLQNRTISHLSEGCAISERISLLAFAEQVGDSNTADILNTVALEHPCGRTRKRAQAAVDIVNAGTSARSNG